MLYTEGIGQSRCGPEFPEVAESESENKGNVSVVSRADIGAMAASARAAKKKKRKRLTEAWHLTNLTHFRPSGYL